MLNISLRQRLIADSTWAFSAKLLTGIAQVVVGILLAKILTPHDFGQFQVIQRIILLGAVLGSLGMGWVIVRKVAEGVAHEKTSDSYYAALRIFQIVAIASLLVAIVFWAVGDEIAQHAFNLPLKGMIFIIGLCIILLSIQQIAPECFRGMHEIKYASIFSGVSLNLIFVLMLAISSMLLEKSSLMYSVQLYFIASLLTVIASLAFLYRMMSGLKGLGSETHGIVLDALKIGTPLLATTLLTYTITQADVMIVAAYFSAESAAYYAASSRLIIMLTVPLMVMNAVIKPIVVQLLAKNEKIRLESYLRKVANVTLSISFIPAVFILLWPEIILSLLFGDFYRQGAEVLRILTVAQLTTLILGPCSILIVMAGRQKQLMKFTTYGALVYLLSVLFMSERIGVEGVALSVVIGTMTSQGLIAWDCYKNLGINTSVGLVRKKRGQ